MRVKLTCLLVVTVNLVSCKQKSCCPKTDIAKALCVKLALTIKKAKISQHDKSSFLNILFIYSYKNLRF